MLNRGHDETPGNDVVADFRGIGIQRGSRFRSFALSRFVWHSADYPLRARTASRLSLRASGPLRFALHYFDAVTPSAMADRSLWLVCARPDSSGAGGGAKAIGAGACAQ